ncbi:MAG TPA: hypothetical protein VGK09_02185 [Rhodocyclaceae bacterium]|jgi:hypothetical protein
MSGKEIKYVTVGFKVPVEVRDRWAKLAEDTGNSLSEFLRKGAAGLEENLKALSTTRQNDGRVLALLDEILAAVKDKNGQTEARATADIPDIESKAPAFAEEPVSAQDEMPVAALAEATRVPVLDDKGRVKLKPVGFEISSRLKGMGAVDSRLGYLVVPQEIDAEPFKEFFA